MREENFKNIISTDRNYAIILYDSKTHKISKTKVKAKLEKLHVWRTNSFYDPSLEVDLFRVRLVYLKDNLKSTNTDFQIPFPNGWVSLLNVKAKTTSHRTL